MSDKPSVSAVKNSGAVFDPTQTLNLMLGMLNTWVSEINSAKTDRAEISAWKDTQVVRIQTQGLVLLKALELTFDERHDTFENLFKGLDKSMESGDAAQVASFLESITQLAQTSPFASLSNIEIVVDQLKRSDQVWEI